MHRSVGGSVRDVWSELLRLGYSGGRRLCSTATTNKLMASELDARAQLEDAG
jgi:hypothetical protein